jgi:DNA polymerase-3 subunit alpha
LSFFPRTFERCRPLLRENVPVLIHGKINYNEEMNVSVIADRIEALDHVRDCGQQKTHQNFTIHEPQSRYNNNEHGPSQKKLVLAFQNYSEKGKLNRIKPLLKAYPGDTPVLVQFQQEHKKFGASRSLWVTANPGLIKKLKGILGEDKVKLR